jgi:iron complex transport system ATP-binding protein
MSRPSPLKGESISRRDRESSIDPPGRARDQAFARGGNDGALDPPSASTDEHLVRAVSNGDIGSVLIECRGLRLQAGTRLLVDALDLRVEAGSRWVVLGPNGAGKSTLLATLSGARHPDGGEVVLAGRPLEDWDVQALAAQRVLLPDGWLDPFAATVLETVLTARYRLGDADEEGSRVALGWLARFDCAGLRAHDVRSLSRGERQRVAIATALTQDAPLLLLDEPIAHQDPRHQALVIEQLAQLPGHTLVASLHDLNAAARLATHALLLTGRGDWVAGAADDVLTAEQLSRLFATPIERLQVAADMRIFVPRSRR